MASLQVRGADYSATKQKAIEDAKKMQLHIVEECNKAGKEPPPYILLELIGKGSYGRVYKSSDVKASRVVAVKIIDIDLSDTLNPKLADTYSEIMKEINALQLLSDGGARNVNQVLEAIPVQHSMWIITEYCAGGSVSTLMQPTAPNGLQEKWIIPILREVAEAIYWVHRAGIIHRDIKCANVLVTETGAVQLCDFGVAGVIETRFDKRSTVIGTPNWMAPELFEGSNSYGTEVDIWAFGAMIIEIAQGLPPNAGMGFDLEALGKFVKKHTPRLEGDRFSPQLKDLVAYCLEDDPAKRPPIEDIQRHPYLANTEAAYPTSSLTMLVRGYRLWESQGGSRKSLFNPGGAQGIADSAESSSLAADEWNFSTTMDFDRQVFETSDNQDVYDVYGSSVDLPSVAFAEETSRLPKMKGRRRMPPPQLPVVKAPLEKVFDPNTISDYKDNSRVYYGLPPPPPPSDLPLRDDSLHSTLRESLIDLDASLHGSDLSSFTDMDTIRASVPRNSQDYDYNYDDYDYDRDDLPDFNKPPLSDPADHLSNNRRTQDWKFPAMQPPLSANPEMPHFSFHSGGDDAQSFSSPGSVTPGPSPGRPPLLHHPTDPTGLSSMVSSQTYDLSVPHMHDNRMSMNSLIDLDESLPDSMPELTRPSTANSDVASVSGSEIGAANPFEFEKHASLLYEPSSGSNAGSFAGREPSIYVSDDSDLARLAKAPPEATSSMPNLPAMMNGGGGNTGTQRRIVAPPPRPYDDSVIDASTIGGAISGDYLIEAEYIPGDQGSQQLQMPQQQPLQQPPSRRAHRFGSGGRFGSHGFSSQSSLPEQQPEEQHRESPLPDEDAENVGPQLAGLPPLPGPPSARVLQGLGSRQEVRDELQRMLTSFHEHLGFTNNHISGLPIRRNAGGSRLETQVE